MKVEKCKMAREKKIISNFTLKVGLILLAGCILVPISLATMFGLHVVPLETLKLLFSVDSTSSVMWEGVRIGSHRSGRREGPVLCDFSSRRSDVCELKGDVRILPNATIVVFHPKGRHQSWRMKPHARKNDARALARVTEVTITSSSSHPAGEEAAPPPCTAEHAAPAVVFSVGGYAGNMFHDLTDVLVPLFVTTRRFASGDDVHLLVSDAQPWWLDKYGPLLRGLSRHDVVDMDRERTGVLCYPRVIVGLEFHKEMSVDAARTAGEFSMADFARLARRSYGLARDTTAVRPHGSSRARLLIISRKAARTFTKRVFGWRDWMG